jgi:hypothetical protein
LSRYFHVTKRTGSNPRATRRSKRPQGSFQDLDLLLEQLGSPPLIELGNPAPDDKFLPKRRAGACPATHNRELLGDDLH